MPGVGTPAYGRPVARQGDAKHLPSPCLLCGGSDGERGPHGWSCDYCGWRVGDVPDPDLPAPRIDVVYYLRWRDRIKIGTTHRPRQRLAAIRHEELLAFERGARSLEQQRHREFADLREGGEWFRADARLREHIDALGGGAPPWQSYARWLADAYR